MNVISGLAARGQRTRPLMQAAGNVLLQSVARNFEEEGRPERWQSLSPLTRQIYEGLAVERARATKAWQRATEAGRRRIEDRYVQRWVAGAKILHRTGDLKKSIDIGRVTDDYVEVGSSAPHARIHQFGGVVRPKRGRFLLVPAGGGRFLRLREARIPARPFLVVQDEDKRAIVLLARNYILEGRL
jgi:phage gpG-like protein